ncbi:MAG TPA: hypothetical protein DDZ51_14720 [Planctomycetaceae bacterium]|nr:hypothetical protein [Planctomycetaceae bacterium]
MVLTFGTEKTLHVICLFFFDFAKAAFRVELVSWFKGGVSPYSQPAENRRNTWELWRNCFRMHLSSIGSLTGRQAE